MLHLYWTWLSWSLLIFHLSASVFILHKKIGTGFFSPFNSLDCNIAIYFLKCKYFYISKWDSLRGMLQDQWNSPGTCCQNCHTWTLWSGMSSQLEKKRQGLKWKPWMLTPLAVQVSWFSLRAAILQSTFNSQEAMERPIKFCWHHLQTENAL